MLGFSRSCPVFGLCGGVFVSLCLLACQPHDRANTPGIVFHHVPPEAAGGAGETDVLSGSVINAAANARMVIYVRSRGSWYVQPLTIYPFTTISSDGKWSTPTHLGTEYAAVLVTPDYRPPNTLQELPRMGNSVLAVKATAGDSSSVKPERSIRFSAYDWTVRQLGSDRYGTPHSYSVSNVSVDDKGYLHLHVSKNGNEWTCSEVALSRSLGYGRYILALKGLDKLEPATVFDMFTWDKAGTDQDRREVDTQLTRWGDPNGKDGEYAVQPFFRPTNTYRYSVGASSASLTMVWQSGSVNFTTNKTAAAGSNSRIANHTFTADIPSPKSESIHLNLCTFDYGKVKQTADSEVVLTSFRYLP